MQFAIDDDWVIVTHNSAHFKTLFGLRTIHPGLVCFNVVHGKMNVDVQKRLFQHALIQLQDPDLVNAVLEISLDADFVVRAETYVWPRP